MSAATTNNSIEHCTWNEIARRIEAGAAAILPIGAASKQHGFHLPMNTDRVQAEWLARKIAEQIDVLVWPTVNYGTYPAFVDYAGSTSLSSAVFETMIEEIASGIFRHGCEKLLVLDTGISTIEPVGRVLARFDKDATLHLRIHEGIHYRRVASEIATQSHGGHADELETSLMLALAPDLVNMQLARASPPVAKPGPGKLTPLDVNSPNYSPSGSYGDPTLASLAKGKLLLAAMLEDLIEQAAAFSGQKQSMSGQFKQSRSMR